MQIDDRGEFVGLRAFVNPMVYWIWIAAGVMLLGCLIAAWPTSRKGYTAAAHKPSPAGPASKSGESAA